VADPSEDLIRRLQDAQAQAKLIGRAPVFVNAISSVEAAARGEGAVLISGETGTGKELVARAIHYLGDRAGFPFVPVNCGALLDTLVDDALFGHERGAFTDAQGRRAGLLVQAHRGTLLLDEVGTLTERAQVALLRVLEDGIVCPLGSTRRERVDVRFVAATNAPLGKLVEAGLFRADLYYRLRVFTIDLPPLRQRPEDILPLAAHFLARYSPALGVPRPRTRGAQAALIAYRWPGNVRELEHAILRAIQVSRGDVIEEADLGSPPSPAPTQGSSRECRGGSPSFQARKREVLEAFEREYLTGLLSEHRGNVTSAARAAGKERRELGRLLRKRGLDSKRFRQDG